MISEVMSFNEIVNAEWQVLANKTFTNIETNEHLGYVYAKYNNKCSLSAICTNGRIEFIHDNMLKRVFGENINVENPLFSYQLTKTN
jgi:hypothetical protein